MSQTTILLGTLAALIGLPVGYWIGWSLDQAGAWLDAYLDGLPVAYVVSMELWR